MGTTFAVQQALSPQWWHEQGEARSMNVPTRDKVSICDSGFGYKEVMPKPLPDELRRYYAEKYYQEERSTYAASYSDAEKQYFRNKIEQKYRIVAEFIGEYGHPAPRFLDVGAGEGWALTFFRELGWECLGIDFSDQGCRNHNPAMCQYLHTGDMFETLKALQGTEGFELVWLDNVLEHVVDPLQLL